MHRDGPNFHGHKSETMGHMGLKFVRVMRPTDTPSFIKIYLRGDPKFLNGMIHK